MSEKVHLSYQRLVSRAQRFYPSGEYRPGARIEMSRRAVYEVQRDGSYRRVREVKTVKKAA